MKRFSEQFKKQSEGIHLKASERTALRERIVSYMEYHPLPQELVSARQEKTLGIISEPFVAIKLNAAYLRSFAGVFAVLTIVAVPFVAERSMPGDMLYPVKVEFNEELRSSLSLSPYAKVAWETERLERRISEARLLANEGKLSAEAEQKVAEAIKTHTDAAQRGIAALREDDSDEAAIAEITFASALAVQTEMLENHSAAQEDAEGSSVATLALAVAEARNTAEASQSGVLPSYEKLLGKVEAESTHVYELFETVRKDASKEEIRDMERRLADVERKIKKATLLKEKETATTTPAVVVEESESASGTSTSTEAGEAVAAEEALAEEVPVGSPEETPVSILTSALADIQKLVSYMTHIDVRRNVSLEELVPLSLTPEEQSMESTRLLEEIVQIQEEVSSKEVNGKLWEKVSVGLQDLEIKTTAAVELINTANYEAALSILNEAHQIAIDLQKMTQNEPVREVPVLEEQASSTPAI